MPSNRISLLHLGIIREQYNKRILDYQHKIDALRKEDDLSSPDNYTWSPEKTRRNSQEEDIQLIKDESNNMERSLELIKGSSNTTKWSRKEVQLPQLHKSK